MPRKIEPKLSPKEFLKARRPERFSDSIKKEIGRLDRSVLEYQLSTLNRRSMELAFEVFAKSLCEKVICPNLLEQTGPVAGGDGKVDTQTFPVSEQTKALWYVGVNDSSNQERWAFAVSTQENWKSKCRKDVRKIKGTERGYVKAFCITNRYTKADQRSELEDSLKEETGIDVIILDCSWILDQVFKHGYEQLAIDLLSIEIDWRREVEVGASDYAKMQRIKEIREYINEEVDTSNILPHQINLMLEEAVLSKEIEEPEIQSQGLFDRVVRVSERHGTYHHSFDSHYEYAWAAYWWYEDMVLFEEQFLFCIEIAENLEQSGKWKDVFSLLCLYTTYYRNNEEKYQADVVPVQTRIRDKLNELSLRDERPSNSILSRVYAEFIGLLNTVDMDDASRIFESLLSIIQEGEHLVGFPFNELYNLILELDKTYCDLVGYEKLLDYFTEQSVIRDGETKGAFVWLKRGVKRLESGEPYQAIKIIGKSLIGLYKKESKKELYSALNILSRAYQEVGLLWASRSTLLMASSIATDEFWKSGEIINGQVQTYTRLAKVELLLGRLNYAIAWWGLAVQANEKIGVSVISDEDKHSFDGFLSQCLLNVNYERVGDFRRLPDLLDNYQLFVSRSVLLHILGYDEIVESEYELKVNQEFRDYLKLVRDVDLGAQVPVLKIYEGRYGYLDSSVMGCDIKISFPFRTPIAELAETILSVIESFLSTCMVEQVMIYESNLNIEITADDEDEIEISHEIDTSGSVIKLEVLCSSFTSEQLNISGQRIIQEWLHSLVIDVFAHLVRPKNTELTLEAMLKNEHALERSVSFGSCFVGLQNIMGNNALDKIKGMTKEESLSDYTQKRVDAWDKDFTKEEVIEKALSSYKVGEGEPPKDLTDKEKISHKDIVVQSLIKPRLWDRTVWCGTGFGLSSGGVPMLILLFQDEQAAKSIFEDLVKEVGECDEENRLKVSIIKGINKKAPANYRVCISENSPFDNKKILQMMARNNTMTPLNDANLERFLSEYQVERSYLITYAVLQDERLVPLSFSPAQIKKSDLTVLDEWKIGLNDIEVVAIDSTDDPIIPEGIENPPIKDVMKRMNAWIDR